VRLPTSITLILNGNNLAITRDLRRRVLMMRLNAGVERPEERTFGRDAIEHVLERRGTIIRSVLTLSLAYHQAGRPHVGTTTYGGFQEWDMAVRRPLVWCNLPDPLLPSEGLREIDPDIQNTRAMFSAWHEVFVEGSTTANALRAARKMKHRFDGDDEPLHPDLRDAIQAAVGDRLDSRVLSRWLRRHRDRIIDRLTLVQEEDLHAKVARWRVVKRG
jgi:putative DNA primase/helicase